MSIYTVDFPKIESKLRSGWARPRGCCFVFSRVSSLVDAPSKLARLMEERRKGLDQGGRREEEMGGSATKGEGERGPAKGKGSGGRERKW